MLDIVEDFKKLHLFCSVMLPSSSSFFEFNGHCGMIGATVLTVPALNFIELVLFERDPVGEPPVRDIFFSWKNAMIFAPITSPVTNIDFVHSVRVSSSLIELLTSELDFAEIIAGEIEAVVSCLRCLEPAFSMGL